MVARLLDVLIALVPKLACQRRKHMLPTLVNQNTEFPGVRHRGDLKVRLLDHCYIALPKELGGLGQ